LRTFAGMCCRSHELLEVLLQHGRYDLLHGVHRMMNGEKLPCIRLDVGMSLRELARIQRFKRQLVSKSVVRSYGRGLLCNPAALGVGLHNPLYSR
jgi:hypothetical protein